MLTKYALFIQSMDDSVLHRHTFVHQMAFHEFYTDIHGPQRL